MGAYILRRLLLIVPTMLGIMVLSFLVIQFAPGGPIEQVVAQLSGQGGSATDRITGGGSDLAAGNRLDNAGETNSKYRGAQGLDPKFIAKLEKQFGFDKPPRERFLLMMGNYLQFDFGESYFRKVTVMELIKEKMPVSIALGLWITLISYAISIPLGIRKAVHDGSGFDVWTSGVIIVACAIPGFLFGVLLLVVFAGGSYYDWFPLRGLLSEGLDAGSCAPLHWQATSIDTSSWWRVLQAPGRVIEWLDSWRANPGFDGRHCSTKIVPDYFWHLTLPLTALILSSFATTTLLTKNSFLDEIRKQYVITARAKGLNERQVLYGHVFRNAMLIVIAGFPGAFISAFFTGALLIETVFSLDGLGLLGYRSIIERDYPVVFATLYIFSLMGLLVGLLSDLMYTWIDPRIDFEFEAKLMDATSQKPVPARPPVETQKRALLSPLNQRRLANFKANRRGYWSLWIFLVLFVLSLFAELLANDRPIVVRFKGEFYFPVLTDYAEEVFLGQEGFLPLTDYKIGEISQAISADGWALWPPIRYSYRSVNTEIPEPAPAKPSWLYDKQSRCANYPDGAEDAACTIGSWNWLGTDDAARDVLARVIYGFRISVLFGLILTAASALIGVPFGAVQGYFGGWVDLIFQRVIEIWSSMPSLYILLIMAAVLPPGFWVLLIIMLLFQWVAFVGVVRAEFLRARNFEYVNAARALGVGSMAIMFRHMLPNAMVATLTFLPFILNSSITTLTSLDFLGLGMPPGSPSLGELMNQGRSNLQAPWLALSGFFVISMMLSLLIFVGEAARDAFDPRKTFK